MPDAILSSRCRQTCMLLNIKASKIDLLFVVPDVCLPALGAPAQGGTRCIRMICKTP